jgi:hypothetical protein
VGVCSLELATDLICSFTVGFALNLDLRIVEVVLVVRVVGVVLGLVPGPCPCPLIALATTSGRSTTPAGVRGTEQVVVAFEELLIEVRVSDSERAAKMLNQLLEIVWKKPLFLWILHTIQDAASEVERIGTRRMLPDVKSKIFEWDRVSLRVARMLGLFALELRWD